MFNTEKPSEEKSEENYRIKVDPLDQKYVSEERSITLENGNIFNYKFHVAREVGKEGTNNLVVFIPGAEHNGEAHLNEISQRTEHKFNSVTFDYPQPFSIENVSRGLAKLLAEQPSNRVILHGSSYGGAVLHRVLEQIDDSQLKNVAGVIYECSVISRDCLSSLARIATDSAKKGVLRAATAMRKTDAYGDASKVDSSKILLEMVDQLPESVTLTHGNYPSRAIFFDKDKLVNTNSVLSTLAKESNVDAGNIGIVVESESGSKLGHSPESWSKVHHITAGLIDSFFS